MISEEQQDQASLYVLGLLDAAEANEFEAAMSANAELCDLVRELRDASSELAWVAPTQTVPPALKQRVLSDIALEQQQRGGGATRSHAGNWIPWAIAAAIALFCGKLALDRARLEREIAAARAADPLSGATVVTLTATPDARADSKGIVAWMPNKQIGLIKVSNMPVPEPGKDYQLWVVDAEHQDPISAGILRVSKEGVAEIRFKPADAVNRVKAFAISVEREGGVSKKQGPIVMLGNA
jgi:anti-sigma-K factor RskA